MITSIELKDGLGSLEYGTDAFERPCINYVNNQLEKQEVQLEDCYTILKELTEVYDANEIYDNFLKIVDRTKKKIRKEDILFVEKIGNQYGTKVEVVFLILYMMLIQRGKERVCLPIYYLFFEDYSIKQCVHMLDDMEEESIRKLGKEKDIFG